MTFGLIEIGSATKLPIHLAAEIRREQQPASPVRCPVKRATYVDQRPNSQILLLKGNVTLYTLDK